jgi:hypothetical protein
MNCDSVLSEFQIGPFSDLPLIFLSDHVVVR